MPYSILSGRGHRLGSLKKAVKTMNKWKSVVHWKTGELCKPASGFEYAVLTWLNKNQYDFDWQIPLETDIATPQLKKMSVYHVDLFIKTGPFENRFVEIKGTFNRKSGGGLQKWLWLQARHPTSLLWMKQELIELGIVDKGRHYLAESR